MTVQSVQKALSLLTEIGRTPGRLVDLSDRVGLPTSTVGRLLATLEAGGAVARDGNGWYRIGPEIRALAQSGASVDLPPIARPFMVELSHDLNEAVGLSIPALSTTTTRLMVQAPNPVQAEDWTGTEIPLHGGVIGLVTLATRSDDEVDAYLAADLEKHNANTVVDPTLIRSRIAQLRGGVPLWTHGEWIGQLSSVASVVVDSAGHAVGSLYTYGPTFRFPPDGRAGTIGRQVARTAAVISHELGHRLSGGDLELSA
ncbi:MAG: helix-turn-helix domain-containing protein [Actinomycetia bacterium]|nr:helix-turn-helix domain-containing protein [Actinomycetes bacterium]